jgi:uncharacterized membrane protein YdbT with pleckstrin-like domain
MIWVSYWNFEKYWHSPLTYPMLELPPLGAAFFMGFVAVAFAAVRAKVAKDTPRRVCFAILAVTTVVAGVIMYPRYMWTPPWAWIDYVMIPLFALICATIAVTAILALMERDASGTKTSTETTKEQVKVEPNHHIEALRNYNTSAQFNATGLIVVVFGQFGILTLLESRAGELSTSPVISLIVAYSLILGLGCYFILNYLMFAQFIEKLREYPGVRPLEKLEKELVEKVGKGSLKNARAWFLRRPCLGSGACLLYLFISTLVLWGALNLPPRLS